MNKNILILSLNFMQLPKMFHHIPEATSVSHTGNQIATDFDNYTPNYIESKMFCYKLNTSRSYRKRSVTVQCMSPIAHAQW